MLEITLLCIKVFFCRILDVTLGTVRTIQVAKGRRTVAVAFGFAETFIWFVVVREALTSDIGGLPLALTYASGFAAGTFFGCYFSDKFIKHKICLQIITTRRDDEMIHAIRAQGYGVSVIDVNGSEFSPEKYLLLIEIDSRQQKALRSLVQSLDERAFIMVNESKSVINGYFAK